MDTKKYPLSAIIDNTVANHESTRVANQMATLFDRDQQKIESLQAEVLEQCRLNGMGSEREAKLMGEIERLNRCIKYEQHRAEHIGTHSTDCWTWGPQHYECAVREVEQLRKDWDTDLLMKYAEQKALLNETELERQRLSNELRLYVATVEQLRKERDDCLKDKLVEEPLRRQISELKSEVKRLKESNKNLYLEQLDYRAELEQLRKAQGEPVAWKHDCAALLQNDVELWVARCPHCGKPRDTHPQQASEPMTPEQINLAWDRSCLANPTGAQQRFVFARAVELHHKIGEKQ